MHTSYETILLQRFQDMGHYSILEDYKDTISNKYKKWMVSSYMGHPILYAHLIWNYFTAFFSRYGTLFDLEWYKDTISNKSKKWMVSSYIGRPPLYAHLIWKHFTAAFLRYGTLFDLEGYKDTISIKYKKMNGQFLYRTSHTICTPHMKPFYFSIFEICDIIRFRGV